MDIIKDRFLKNRLLKSVIIITLSYIIFSGLTICYFHLFKISIKKDLEDVLLQIWIIQVTFTTILIAFITVLLSEMRIKFYGIKVLEVIDLKTTFWSMFFSILGMNILTYFPVVIWKNSIFTTTDYFMTTSSSIFYIWKIIDILSHPEKYKELVRELYEDNIEIFNARFFQTNRGNIISLHI